MKYVLPVLASLATTIITGLLLYPLVYIVFDNFFHLYLFTKPPADSWKDDLIIGIAVVLWIFIASFAGGFVSSLLSKKKEDYSILLFITSSLIILLILTKGAALTEFDWMMLLLIIAYAGGAILGNLFGIRNKKKKERLKDIASSQPDTPLQ
jgi:hypothetical protein